MHTMRKLEGKMTLKKVNWGGIVEIGGKVGRLLSGGVDTPVEDERRPLFKTGGLLFKGRPLIITGVRQL